MLRSTLLFLALAFLLLTCKREEDLPPTTQEGLSTFGCLVDGKRFVPYNDDWFKIPSKARYIAAEKTLSIGAFNKKTDQGISFAIADYTGKPGKFVLKASCENFLQHQTNCGSYGGRYASDRDYSTDSQHIGYVQITAHTERFVSGTFEFNAYSPKKQQVVKITKGRFDLWYDTY